MVQEIPGFRSVIETASEVEAFCRQESIDHSFIGGLAYQRWGNPRMTMDADLTILCPFGHEEEMAKRFLERFSPRIQNFEAHAVQYRVMLLQRLGGSPIDASLGALDFEFRMVERASPWEFMPGIELTICSAEDLVTLKAFASRTQDWADIENVLVKQGKKLNFDQIFEELTPLVELKEQPEILTRLRDDIQKYAR